MRIPTRLLQFKSTSKFEQLSENLRIGTLARMTSNFVKVLPGKKVRSNDEITAASLNRDYTYDTVASVLSGLYRGTREHGSADQCHTLLSLNTSPYHCCHHQSQKHWNQQCTARIVEACSSEGKKLYENIYKRETSKLMRQDSYTNVAVYNVTKPQLPLQSLWCLFMACELAP